MDRYIKADENNLLICNSSASFSSATLTCNVTGYSGNFEAYGYIASSPETMKKIINFVISAAREIFGNTGLILGFCKYDRAHRFWFYIYIYNDSSIFNYNYIYEVIK